MGSLKHCAWPGNVWGLINVIDRAVIVGFELQLAEKIDALPENPVRKMSHPPQDRGEQSP